MWTETFGRNYERPSKKEVIPVQRNQSQNVNLVCYKFK